MFKRMIRSVAIKAGARDADRILQLLKVSSDGEAVTALAGTSMARGFLLETESITQPFPEAEFRGFAPLDRAASVRISQYNIQLVQVYGKLQKMPGDGAALLTTGLGVLIPSLRALAMPELFVGGRLIWRELGRGVEQYPEKMALLCPHVAGDAAKMRRLWPFPNMLAPEGVA